MKTWPMAFEFANSNRVFVGIVSIMLLIMMMIVLILLLATIMMLLSSLHRWHLVIIFIGVILIGIFFSDIVMIGVLTVGAFIAVVICCGGHHWHHLFCPLA
ncbi:uncharacterized protein BX664DRAFT_333874 [Halteromyces radiatus]|uniref:uncharacterized protein n=1 Tax=Halteromyces radiatus TaxID=101107 RepID=UPI00221FB2A3|nr:uncharacterized protein BX664DRAFT_333874 [Halteromyces radiatus]KAI8089785.1 hypothetical protein BX664DRAFT_333874 [Halteromyces radiatus]